MSGERIMVVCEQPELRESLAQLLEDQGLESFPAADGIDALRQIYHVQPQVIISDASLSCLSGFEFLPFVRRRFPTVGVIAIETADSTHRDIDFLADRTLPWDPSDPDRVVGHVHELLAQCPMRAEMESDCA